MNPTIKDIIIYLEQFPGDTPVQLDKDGWMGEYSKENGYSTMTEFIDDRNIFYFLTYNGKSTLIINN